MQILGGHHHYWDKSEYSGKYVMVGRRYGINFHRADDSISALEVKESVAGIIRNSDFVLAVITGLNPNVFWEVGYAQCLGKPVVFLIEEAQLAAQRCPILIGATLKRTYDGKIFDALPLDATKIGDFPGLRKCEKLPVCATNPRVNVLASYWFGTEKALWELLPTSPLSSLPPGWADLSLNA